MRPCQLCGVTSWGPVVVAQEVLARMREFDQDCTIDPADYLRCDHCKTVATKQLVDVPTVSPNLGAYQMHQQSAESNASDPLSMVMGVFKDRVAPPNRTERLVHSLLNSDVLLAGGPQTAQSLVGYARDLEHIMDGDGPEFGPVSVRMPMENFRTLLRRGMHTVIPTLTQVEVQTTASELVARMEHDFNE